MNQKKMQQRKKAYIEYSLNSEYNLTENILNYIKERIEANKEECEELIKLNKEEINFTDIIKIVNDTITSEKVYKRDGNIKRYDNDFVLASLTDSVGIIAIECFDTIETIKYFIEAIKSRNAIVISDVEYDEQSLKSFILLIIKEVLKKYNIDKNLITLEPYEECPYDLFDEVIYTYDNEGKTLENNIVKKKEKIDILYVYMEDDFFEAEVNKEMKRIESEGKMVKLLTGEKRIAIDTINSYISAGAVIYTQNPELAYEFVNLVKAENVFVNASLVNRKEIKKVNNELYFSKNIIFQIPKEKEEMNYDKLDEVEPIIHTKKESSLIEIKEGIFEKIKILIGKILKK